MGVKMLAGLFDAVKRIALDSMCFIYYFEQHERYGPVMKSIITESIERDILLFTSTITIAETMTESHFAWLEGTRALYKEELSRLTRLAILPVDIPIAESAAMVRSSYRLKLGDAIQLATAINAGADLFVTNDEQFRRVNDMRVCILDDYIKKN